MTPQAKYAARVYLERKIAGLCVGCAAGLDEDATSVRCVECTARLKRTKKINPVKRRAALRRYYVKYAPKVRAKQRDRHDARKAAGLCIINGCTRPPRETSTRCQYHHEIAIAAQRRRREAARAA